MYRLYQQQVVGVHCSFKREREKKYSKTTLVQIVWLQSYCNHKSVFLQGIVGNPFLPAADAPVSLFILSIVRLPWHWKLCSLPSHELFVPFI